jgi:hypothetical protein
MLLHVSTVNYNHPQGAKSVEDFYSVLISVEKNKWQNVYTNMCHPINVQYYQNRINIYSTNEILKLHKIFL